MCYLQYKLIGFYNRNEKCLQRGTDWAVKSSGLRFVFKGLSWRSDDFATSISPLYTQLAVTFHTENVSIVTVIRRASYHILSISVSLGIFRKMKLRNFRTAGMFIYHIL
jgi:hypothetical protein